MNEQLVIPPLDIRADSTSPVGRIDPLDTISVKAQIFKRINAEIPQNEYGLPEYIYRADLIPTNLGATAPLQDYNTFLDAAIIELDYSQGFPTLPDGEPFWAALPGESFDAHRIFASYLDIPRKATPGNPRGGAARQVHMLKDETGMRVTQLLTLSHTFYWQMRAQAYDLFITASHNKRREYLLQTTEVDHFEMATRYLENAQQFLDKVFQDPETHDLKPSDAINLLVKMAQVQRISLGVSPFGQKTGKDENELPKNATLEMILRTIVQKSGLIAKDPTQTLDTMNSLFDNPEDLRQAQELIIRIGDARNPKQSLSAAVLDGHSFGQR